MLTATLVVFALAAVGGVYLGSRILSKQLAPWAVSGLHALLGATGLVLLVVMYLERPAGAQRMGIALALLVVAALGGFYLASIHVRKEMPPKAVLVLHAGLAVAGFLTLLSLLVWVP